jgi:hypothetical protein
MGRIRSRPSVSTGTAGLHGVCVAQLGFALRSVHATHGLAQLGLNVSVRAASARARAMALLRR